MGLRSLLEHIAASEANREVLLAVHEEWESFKMAVRSDIQALGDRIDSIVAQLPTLVQESNAAAVAAADGDHSDEVAFLAAKVDSLNNAVSGIVPAPAETAQPVPVDSGVRAPTSAEPVEPTGDANATQVTVSSLAPQSDGSTLVTYSDGTTETVAAGDVAPVVGSVKA